MTGRVERIDGVDPGDPTLDARARALFDAQAERWGAPLHPYRFYAHVPEVLRAVRGMWAALATADHVDARLHALVNRRVASLNGCEF